MRLLWLFLALVPLHAWAQQSARDDAFWQGLDITPERRKLVEAGPTDEIFTNPRDSRTQDYITGRFG